MDAAIGLIFNATKDQILLVKRRDVPVWVLPGGGIDVGETAEQAVIREVFEETGLRVKILRKVAEYTPINRLSQQTHTYECQFLKGKLMLSDEARDIGYFDLKKLPKSLFFVHRDWINDALVNQQNIIKKPISQVTYFALLKYFCRKPWQVLRFLWTRLLSD